VFGIIRLVKVITQGAYTEIEWIICGIAASIYFNGMEVLTLPKEDTENGQPLL